jgi:CelD/BcsL family acetyltransferase involved in cellulose biosynthesis
VLTIKIINKFEDFLKLEFIWSELLSNSDSDTPFLTFEWVKCWWQAFGKSKELLIILIKNEKNNIIAIAPLMRIEDKYRNFNVRTVCFIKDSNSSHSNFIIIQRNDEVLKRIFSFLHEIRDTWDLIVLDYIIDEINSYSSLKKFLKESNSHFLITNQHRSPYISVGSDWETFYMQKSAKFRKTLRNEINRINKVGEVKIEEIVDTDKLDEVLEEIRLVSEKSWKGRVGSDFGHSQENFSFFKLLSEECKKKGWLSIWFLKVNNKTIAMEYHIKYKNKIYGLRGDFDESYKYCSPGAVLDYHIVKNVFMNHFAEYDMCGEAYKYKLEWTSLCKNHQKITIYNKTAYGTSLYFLETKMVPVVRKIKRKIGIVGHIK